MRSLQQWIKHPNAPILALIVFNLIIGLLTVEHYGLTLDEPFYYQYGEDLGYAYSPKEWFSDSFDLSNSYGPSEWDHRDRGPAYLFLARIPASLLQTYLGFDFPSAWHFMNFLTLQLGLFWLYIFLQRWASRAASFTATLFFNFQPIIWGHGFINPKDIPFLVFFLLSTELGFRMVEAISALPKNASQKDVIKVVLVPALVMGLSTNMRILGPLSGILVFIYFLLQKDRSRWVWFIPYGLIGFTAFFLCWPYLWVNTIEHITEVVIFMSDNPTELRVLFYGQIFTADQLPTRYLPTMLFLTLTEPFWFLGLGGLVVLLKNWKNNKKTYQTLLLSLIWFAIPVLYALLRHPAMYDGFRHSMFIVPPIIALGALCIDFIYRLIKKDYLKVIFAISIILPGVFGIIKLHPYEYAYYNQFVGGTGQAAKRFETDYWNTCYKEAMEYIRSTKLKNIRIHVGAKGVPIIKYYADNDFQVIKYSRYTTIWPGDFVISTSRANNTIQLYSQKDDDKAEKIGRDGAIFCRVELPKPIQGASK